MQFQHGSYSRAANGSLHLTPFAEDGRELVSSPCKSKLSTYTLYNQTETFKVRGSLPLSYVDCANPVDSDTKLLLIHSAVSFGSTFTSGMALP